MTTALHKEYYGPSDYNGPPANDAEYSLAHLNTRWVYFAERDGRIKIGTSKQVDVRMRALGAALLAVAPGGFDVERSMHRRFAAHALGHEWFADVPELRQFIASLPVPEDPPVREDPPAPSPQVITADELAELTKLSPRTIRDRVKRNGHVLGVRPVPDTGRRVLFSRVLVERALHGDENVA